MRIGTTLASAAVSSSARRPETKERKMATPHDITRPGTVAKVTNDTAMTLQAGVERK
jgi:hypothetical protein